MELADATWYTSGTVWAIAGVVAVVVMGAVGVLFGWLAVNPTRRLFYEMPVITPLLNVGHVQDLKVYLDDTHVTSPQALEVVISSQGRLDIPSSAFDRDTPIKFDVGAKILKVLKLTSSPDNHGNPKVDTDGTMLLIGPSLIGRRQRISLSLLVDGSSPTLTCPGSPLVDVRVVKGPPTPSTSTQLIRVALAVTALPILVTISLVSRRVLAGISAGSSFWIFLTEGVSTVAAAGVTAWLLVWLLARTIDIRKPEHPASKSELWQSLKTLVPFFAMISAFFLSLLFPGWQPDIGTTLGHYSVQVSSSQGIPFRNTEFAPMLHPGDITFSKKLFTSKNMLLASIGKERPGFNNCEFVFFPGGKHTVSLPPPGRTVCAVGANVTIAMTVTSASDQQITLRVIVWEGNLGSN